MGTTRSIRWRATSGLAAGERGWPACARGRGRDGDNVVAANVLPQFEMRWRKVKVRNTYLNVLGRAAARSLGACKTEVVLLGVRLSKNKKSESVSGGPEGVSWSL